MYEIRLLDISWLGFIAHARLQMSIIPESYLIGILAHRLQAILRDYRLQGFGGCYRMDELIWQRIGAKSDVLCPYIVGFDGS